MCSHFHSFFFISEKLLNWFPLHIFAVQNQLLERPRGACSNLINCVCDAGAAIRILICVCVACYQKPEWRHKVVQNNFLIRRNPTLSSSLAWTKNASNARFFRFKRKTSNKSNAVWYKQIIIIIISIASPFVINIINIIHQL